MEQRLSGVPGSIGAHGPLPTLGNIISHVLLLHNLSPAWVLSINGSFWSLALEWQWYMVFPLLVWGFRRWGVSPTMIAVLALTLIYRTGASAAQDLLLLGTATAAARRV
jgi:peptidoglycan/LPS O-acetylase OafA/YrhL